MTKEEAIEHGKEQLNIFGGQHREFIEMAIKALDSIDEIRAEIENINLNEVAAKYEDRFYGFQREVIKIIDKYKAESED